MKFYPNDLSVDTFNSHFTENEFYLNYLQNSSFRGFYYGTHDRSYGIILQFSQHNQHRLDINAIASDGILPVIEYRMSSDIFLIDLVAYDKVLISTSKHKIETSESNEIKAPRKLEFTLQLLTRNSFFIRFLEADQYSSPVRSLKGGLVLARETGYPMENYESAFQHTNSA